MQNGWEKSEVKGCSQVLDSGPRELGVEVGGNHTRDGLESEMAVCGMSLKVSRQVGEESQCGES